MDVPEPLKRALVGTPIVSTEASETKGLSTVGTKTVAFTDGPAACVHDTGGIFGEEAVWSFVGDDIHPGTNVSFTYFDKSSKLAVRLRPNNQVEAIAHVEGKKAGRVHREVLEPLVPRRADAAFDLVVPVSVVARLEDSRTSLARYAEQSPKAQAILHQALVFDADDAHSHEAIAAPLFDWDEVTPQTCGYLLAASQVAVGEIPLRVGVRGGRLVLHRRWEVIVLDLPLAHLNVAREKREVRLKGPFEVGGFTTNEIQVHLPTAQLAAELAEVLGRGPLSPDIAGSGETDSFIVTVQGGEKLDHLDHLQIRDRHEDRGVIS